MFSEICVSVLAVRAHENCTLIHILWRITRITSYRNSNQDGVDALLQTRAAKTRTGGMFRYSLSERGIGRLRWLESLKSAKAKFFEHQRASFSMNSAQVGWEQLL